MRMYLTYSSGDSVFLKDGTPATVVENKGGWCTISVQDIRSGKRKRVKVRSNILHGGLDKAEDTLHVPDVISGKRPESFASSSLSLKDCIIDTPEWHSAQKKWLVFSDLHVKPSSIETCEQVLSEVHSRARALDAGVIFLGDFWHIRGTLNVELLNRVMESFSSWTQPVVMIPGNHDQVSLGGIVHALEPLRYAFKHQDQMLLLSEPSLCLDALWLPYRREEAVLRPLLSEAVEWVEKGDLGAVFCHADVRGAFMNDNQRSRRGLDIATFPPHIPIYSGHFHKPHNITYRATSLRYVGSPYQTGLAEAGQDKFLYELSAPSTMKNKGEDKKAGARWYEVARHKIDVGPKFYRAVSTLDPVCDMAQSGDKVVLQVNANELSWIDALNGSGELFNTDIDGKANEEGGDLAMSKRIQAMRERGVRVELRGGKRGQAKVDLLGVSGASDDVFMSKNEKDESDGLGEMTDKITHAQYDDKRDWNTPIPANLFVGFVEGVWSVDNPETLENGNSTQSTLDQDVGAPVINDMRQEIMKEGLAVLARVEDDRTVSSKDGAASGTRTVDLSQSRHLEWHEIRLRNFGPYGTEDDEPDIVYPLDNRGLVLVRAESDDGTGADSNGAGKTSLVMSLLWALTGQLDPRLVADARSPDVVFDAQRKAQATTISTAGRADSTKKKTNKRTKIIGSAELKGSIDGKPFVLHRRRTTGKYPKTDLKFIVDGNDLTQQAVRDTQAVIDNVLGAGDGLLARCCFFGQHSHAIGSLLALSDVHLKQELAALVDVDLWTAAANDVRSRERNAKTLLDKIEVEYCVRGDELARREREEEEARQLSNSIRGTSKTDTLRSAADDVEISRLQQELEHLLNGPDGLAASQRSLEKARHTVAEAIQAQALGRQRRIDTQKNIDRLHHRLNSVDAQLALLDVLSIDVDSVEKSRAEHNEGVRLLATLVAKEQRLEADCVEISNLVETAARPHIHVHADDGRGVCPTCGQTLLHDESSHADLSKKLVDLKTKLSFAHEERLLQEQITEQLATAAERTSKAEHDIARAEQLRETHAELTSELATMVRQEGQTDLKLGYEARTSGVDEQEAVDTAQEALVIAQQRLAGLEDTIQNRRHSLEQARSSRAVAQERAKHDEEREREISILLKEKTFATQQAREIMIGLEQRRSDARREQLICGQLVGIFGARGVQQYLVLEAINLLEDLTNRYLDVLAEGGIQLRLEGTNDSDGNKGVVLAERVSKTILVKGEDGLWRERVLAQLSGGQWRRVSLALDLAFAEAVRQRGTLRSSLLVMDEVLTHLDASGREAVGKLLRRLAGPPGGVREIDEISNDLADGNSDGIVIETGVHDTVLVILQDLAATELEESFDSIDVVIKDGDVARLHLDE